MLADYELLFKACEHLEEVIEASVFGAAKQSHSISNIPKRWDRIVQKLGDIKLVNAKTIFLNSLIMKDQIPIPEDLTLKEAINNLNISTDAHERWDTAIKTKSISRTVYFALLDEDEEVRSLFSELLLKISCLDEELNKMDEEIMLLSRRLSEVKNHWKKTSIEYLEKKAESENRASQNGEELPDSELRSHLSKKIQKIEVLKLIQGKLLASCETYDWLHDPDDLHKYLVSTRREPYKVEDFLYSEK